MDNEEELFDEADVSVPEGSISDHAMSEVSMHDDNGESPVDGDGVVEDGGDDLSGVEVGSSSILRPTTLRPTTLRRKSRLMLQVVMGVMLAMTLRPCRKLSRRPKQQTWRSNCPMAFCDITKQHRWWWLIVRTMGRKPVA